LGLAIAKQLVEAQGGTISARNLPEGGLQVWIELNK
jgi:signal transduction histidine kinase